MASRICQSSFACVLLSAMTPSATRASSRAASSSLSNSPRTPLSVWLDDISSSTYQPRADPRYRDMGESQIEGCARDQLERRQLVGGGGAGAPEEAHHVLDPAEPEESGFDFARFGKELNRRGSDDAEGALAADEELLQIVAGIVLAQAAKAVPNPSVGQHHLEAQCQLAGFAVAQDRDAAGVGRQIAADLTGPLGPEAEREQSVGLGGRLLQVRED